MNNRAAQQPGPVIEKTITETTVGTFGGFRVGVGNIFRDVYELPDGSKRKGMTARLFVNDSATGQQREPLTVGQGSRVSLNSETWEVVRVAGSLLGRGSVTLRRADS